MANGFAKPLLQDLATVAGAGYPGTKMRLNGFTAMAISNTDPGDIQITSVRGHKRQVDIKYKQRPTDQMTDTSASCDNVIVPSWLETTVSMSGFRQFAIHWDDATIQNYMDDASARVNLPGSLPGTSAFNEILKDIQHAMNAIFTGVNKDLLGMVTWGKNTVTGLSTATSLNFSADTSVQKFDQGFPRLLADYAKNNLTGTPQVVGAGNFMNVVLAQNMRAATDNSGYDPRIALNGMDYWADQTADLSAYFGNNVIGVFEPGSVKFVEHNLNTGNFAGDRGVSQFFTISLPYVDTINNRVVPITVDAQLKYRDCEQTLTDAYTGSTFTAGRGYTLILSKYFGLFQIPSDAYRHEDANRSVNGALRYSVTTNCDTCA